jgi:predicted kinase
MNKTIFMLKGLPASGKSTECARLLADPALAPITAVSRDEIRKARGIKPGDFEHERDVRGNEAVFIMAAVMRGENVVIDNIHPGAYWVERYKRFARSHGYDFELIDLSHVPVAECIRRDSLRTDDKRVGPEIIMKYWREESSARGEF